MVDVAIGDRVTAGQVLATADTIDLEDQIAEVDMSLGSARITLREAQADLADARTQHTGGPRRRQRARLLRRGSP